MFRQGDVLIIEVGALPEGEQREVGRDNGRIVLAYGEVTGHAHAIRGLDVKMIAVGDSCFLQSASPFVVEHEEHTPMHIPEGMYQVLRQREYAPEAVRVVAD